MPASPARIAANQANAKKSCGPKTPEGKAASRGNALKHGMTGAGVVLPEGDAAEVERLAGALREELDPPGEIGDALVRRVAVLIVRMDRSAAQESAATSARVGRAMEEFEAPEGIDAETAEKLRAQAGRLALFDPSKEACLARQYEAAAQRGFFRALKELRQLKKEAKAADPVAVVEASREATRQALASFSGVEKEAAGLGVRLPKPTPPPPSKLPDSFLSDDFMASDRRFDVPFTIGRRR